MEAVVLIDGVVRGPDDAAIGVFDRGFLYGDSAFEVLRTYGRVPFALGAHLERLERSCERLLFGLPVPRERLAAEVAEAVRRASWPESYLRIVVTRGSGPVTYDPATAVHPRRLVLALPVVPLPPEAYERGVGVHLQRVSRPTDGTRAAGAKASNYLAHILATHEARHRGDHEAIVLGEGGELLEGATSNLFLVRGDAVETPPVAAGILAGITRAQVLALAEELGLPCRERMLFPADLYGADEAFLTSSIREVVPVVRADGLAVGTGRPGPVVDRLRRAFRALTARS